MTQYSAYMAHPALIPLTRLYFTTPMNDDGFLGLIHPTQPFSIKDMTPVIEYIFSRNGVVKVKNLTNKFHISRRWLEKQFAEQVGISPKQMARLIRFNALLLSVEMTPSVSWSEMIDKFGYYDQSHLNKDFHEFTGLSPTDYFKDTSCAIDWNFHNSIE